MIRIPGVAKNSVTGWTKWLPVIMLPFAILFFEAWLNTQTIKRDYKMSELNAHIRELKERLDGLNLDIARLQNMNRIEIEAPDMGLVPAEPSQIHVLYENEPPPMQTQDFVTAAAPKTGPGAVVEKVDDRKGEKCSTGTATRQARLGAAMERLSKAITGAYVSCFGHS